MMRDIAICSIYTDLYSLNIANPDHASIYLTLSNSFWNYWDGFSFVEGGKYEYPEKEVSK